MCHRTTTEDSAKVHQTLLLECGVWEWDYHNTGINVARPTWKVSIRYRRTQIMWLTSAEKIIAGIPKPKESKLRIAQMMAVIMLRIRKSWGALWGTTGTAAATDVGNWYPGPPTGGAFKIVNNLSAILNKSCIYDHLQLCTEGPTDFSVKKR